jgi:hypothetical protein
MPQDGADGVATPDSELPELRTVSGPPEDDPVVGVHKAAVVGLNPLCEESVTDPRLPAPALLEAVELAGAGAALTALTGALRPPCPSPTTPLPTPWLLGVSVTGVRRVVAPPVAPAGVPVGSPLARRVVSPAVLTLTLELPPVLSPLAADGVDPSPSATTRSDSSNDDDDDDDELLRFCRNAAVVAASTALSSDARRLAAFCDPFSARALVNVDTVTPVPPKLGTPEPVMGVVAPLADASIALAKEESEAVVDNCNRRFDVPLSPPDGCVHPVADSSGSVTSSESWAEFRRGRWAEGGATELHTLGAGDAPVSCHEIMQADSRAAGTQRLNKH